MNYVLFKMTAILSHLFFELLWAAGKGRVLFKMQLEIIRVVEGGLGMSVSPRAMPVTVAYGQSAARLIFLF